MSKMSESRRPLDIGECDHTDLEPTVHEKEPVDVSAGDHPPPPDGGLEAWLVVLGAWLALVSSLGLMNTLATFQSYLTTHQLADYDEGTVGWIFSVYTFMVFFLGLYIGPLFDKHGPRWLILTVFGKSTTGVNGQRPQSLSPTPHKI